MNEDWMMYRFDDLGKIITGRTPPTKNPEFFGDKYPFITPSDMDGRKRATSTERYLSDAGAKLLQRNLLSPEVVSVSCIGWQMGKSIMTCYPSFTNQQLNSIIPNKDLVDPEFLYYSLQTRREELLSLGSATGVRTPILNKSAFSDLEIALPPLGTQGKIATILSAYDDQIENNTRRIQILEEIAQAIYREWFVNFRFPGHENVRMVNLGTELGEVPEGWKVGSFTDYIDVMSGGTPKTKVPEYWSGDIPWFTPKDLTYSFFVFDTDRKISELGLSKCNSKLYPPNTVFITARGTVGKCVIAAVPMAMSQTNYALLGRDNLHQFFVFLLSLSMVEILKKQATGAVFDTIIVDTFRMQNIIVPPNPILDSFIKAVSPLINLVKILQKKNSNLHATRDLLLPKLVSGQVDVSQLEIEL